MKRNLAIALSIVAIAAVTGWMLTSHTETSTALHDIRLVPHSEHSNPGSTEVLAGIRIRLSPSDFDDVVRATDHEVPQIALATE